MGSPKRPPTDKPKPPPKVNKANNEKPLDSKSKLSIKGILISLILSLVFASFGTYLFARPLIDPVEFSLPEVPPFEDGLAVNNKLTKAERLLVDQIYGPESLAIHPVTGHLWASLKTGLICEISVVGKKPEIRRAVRLTNFTDCDGSYPTFPRCGRPLGLRITPKGELLVADAYLGLYLIDMEKEKVSQLFTGGAEVANDLTRPTRFINDLDVMPNGVIIISESSHRFDDRDFILDLFEHKPNGRLLGFKPATGELRVIQKDLYFPNGVQVLGDHIYFAEMGMARIQRMNSKTFKVDTLIDGLPGYPDNIRLDPLGQLLVPIPTIRDSFDAWLAERPKLRGFITKVFSARLLGFIGEMTTTAYGLVLKIDPITGSIVESYHDPKGQQISAISIALETKEGEIYLGSDTNFFLGRVKAY